MSTERAKYRVLATTGFFADDDTLYDEGSEIWFDGEPNEEMEPLNEVARVRLIEYLEKLDRFGREAAEKAGRPYAGRPRTLDGALAVATAIQKQEMVAMGAKKSSSSVEKVEENEVPMIAPRKRGRPRLNVG